MLEGQESWERQQREMPVAGVTAGLTAEYPFADSLADRLHSDATPKLLNGKVEFADGLPARAADLDTEPQLSFGPVAAFSSEKPFAVAFWVKADGPSGMAIFQRFAKSAKEGIGYEIALDYCAKNTCDVIVRLRDRGADSGIEVKSQRGAALESWSHIALTYDGSRKAKGLQIYVDGQAVPVDVIRDEPLHSVRFDQGELQTGNKEWGTAFKGQLSDLRFYDRRLYSSEISELAVFGPLQKTFGRSCFPAIGSSEKMVARVFRNQHRQRA